MPRAARSSAEVLERTRRASRHSSGGPSFAAPTRSSSRRRASARGASPVHENATFRQSFSERSVAGPSPRTPAAASRRNLRRSQSDLSRSSPTLDLSERDRRRAEDDFLAQRAEILEHRRRSEEAAGCASPTPEVPADERERAEAEFMAERERVLNDRKRSEELAASRSLPPDHVTEEDAELVRADEESLLPHNDPAASLEKRSRTTDVDAVPCEEVLLTYYAQFEPTFATPEKVNKIVQTFKARSEKLGKAELFREQMYGAIAAQRDVHPLKFYQAQDQATDREQRRDQDQTIEQPPPIQQQKPKRGFRDRLGFKSKKGDGAKNRARRTTVPSPDVEVDAASPFSPRKSLSRTPPSSPPVADQQDDASPLVPLTFSSRPPDALLKSPRVEAPAGANAMDKATAAVRIQAACRGYQVRAEIERIASAPGDDLALAPDCETDHLDTAKVRDSLPLVGRARPISDTAVGDRISFSPCELSPQEQSDDVALLMGFYRRVEPTFANQQKVERIIERFRNRKTAPGESWRDLMYAAITKQRGIDPRDSRVVASTPIEDSTLSPMVASTATMSPGARSPAPPNMYAWAEQRSAVALDLKSIMLTCAQLRLCWARVLQSSAPLHPALPWSMTPLSVPVANALSTAVVARAALSLYSECHRETLCLREMKRSDISTRGTSSKRHQHYDDEEAAKVMRQVRTEVGVLAREMTTNQQQIKGIDLQQILESLGRQDDTRRRLQSLCATAVESFTLVAQMRLEKRFNWGLHDGDCVALMEDLLVRVENIKAESESAQLSRRESAMMGARRAADMGTGMYELQRDAAVRSHPGCLSKWVGAVAPGERVRVAKVVSDNSGILFAKVDEDGLLGWIALGSRPGDDDKPVMKRVPLSQAALAAPVLGPPTPPSRASSANESPPGNARDNAEKQQPREPQKHPGNKTQTHGVTSSDSRRGDTANGKANNYLSTPPVPKAGSPADSPEDTDDPGGERWARQSTQAQRLATVRHELGRDAASSPGTRGLEDKLQALEAQLGTLTSDLQSDSGSASRRQTRGQMRASWSPNAAVASRNALNDEAWGAHPRQQSHVGSPASMNTVQCIQESWDTQKVIDWLVSVGLAEYVQAFSANSMDGEAMLELERWRRRAYDGAQGGNEGSLFADCLRGLGLAKTGHVLKFCRYLAESTRELTL